MLKQVSLDAACIYSKNPRKIEFLVTINYRFEPVD